MAAQRIPLLQSSDAHGDDEESQRLSARRPASPAESIADACGDERRPPPMPAKSAAGEGDGQLPIIVRTGGGPRARRRKPVEDPETCCDCAPLCRRFGMRRFPPCKNCWCVRDVCGMVCASFTWLLIFYAEFVVVCVMLIPSPSPFFRWINGTVFHFFSSLALLSHWKAMFSNPGAIPLGNATRENILRMGYRGGQVIYKCPSCCSIKPDRAHHCSVCRRCIRKMDHHCPWVNNCVGESNQKYFVLFTLYICIISFYAIYMSIHFFVICIGSDWEACKSGYSPPFTTVFIVFLIVEAILFGLFTSIMCGEQIQAIWNDETGIESLKKEQRAWERKSRWVSMEAVFGHPFSWRWFSPLSPPNALPRHNDAFTYTSYYAV